MAAIDDLNTTINTFATGLNSAKAALQGKGIDTTGMTIANIGAYINRIVIPVTYTFTISASQMTWGAVSDAIGKTATITSTSSTGASVGWSYSYATGDTGSFDMLYHNNDITVTPKLLRQTSTKTAVYTFTQSSSGLTRTLTAKQLPSDIGGELPIEM